METPINVYSFSHGDLDMVRSELFAKAVVAACAASIFLTPVVANAQFGSLLKDLKSVEDALKKTQNNTAQTQQSNTKNQQESALNNAPKNEEKSQPSTTQDLAPGIQSGFYRKGSDTTLHIKNVGKNVNFSLSLGHTKKEMSCEEGVVDCLTIDGVMKASSAGFFFKDSDFNCSFKAALRNGNILISESDGDCGSGSMNRQQLRLINGEYKLIAGANQNPTSNSSSTGLTSNQFGYLAGQIKTYEGVGCTYYRKEDEKKKNPKFLAADDYSGKGIVINMNGKDVLLKEKSRNLSKNYEVSSLQYEDNALKLVIKYGASKVCGEECSKNLNIFEFSSGDQKITVPTYSICGS